jgi:hypothetical protein
MKIGFKSASRKEGQFIEYRELFSRNSASDTGESIGFVFNNAMFVNSNLSAPRTNFVRVTARLTGFASVLQ